MANYSPSLNRLLTRAALVTLIACPVGAAGAPEAVEPPVLEFPAQAPRLYLNEAKVYPQTLQSTFHRTGEEGQLRDRLRPSSRVTKHNLMNSRFANYLTGMFAKSDAK